MPPNATKASIRGVSMVRASPEYPVINWLWRTYHMSQWVKIIFGGVWSYMRTFINPMVKNKINLMNLLAATYHGRFRPSVHTLSGRTGSALVWHSEVARLRLTQCSKSCDLQPALQCTIRGTQGVLPCVGWGVRPVNWIYRLRRHFP